MFVVTTVTSTIIGWLCHQAKIHMRIHKQTVELIIDDAKKMMILDLLSMPYTTLLIKLLDMMWRHVLSTCVSKKEKTWATYAALFMCFLRMHIIEELIYQFLVRYQKTISLYCDFSLISDAGTFSSLGLPPWNLMDWSVVNGNNTFSSGYFLFVDGYVCLVAFSNLHNISWISGHSLEYWTRLLGQVWLKGCCKILEEV